MEEHWVQRLLISWCYCLRSIRLSRYSFRLHGQMLPYLHWLLLPDLMNFAQCLYDCFWLHIYLRLCWNNWIVLDYLFVVPLRMIVFMVLECGSTKITASIYSATVASVEVHFDIANELSIWFVTLLLLLLLLRIKRWYLGITILATIAIRILLSIDNWVLFGLVCVLWLDSLKVW